MTNLLLSALAQPPIPDLKSPDSPFFWVPVQASTVAEDIDALFVYIMWCSVVSCVLLLGLMIYFAWKYKARSRKDKPQPSTDHNTTLEVTWSVLPLFFVIVMFIWGFQGFMALRTSPRDSYEVHVTAQKWKWIFEYENGHMDDTLHAPVNKKIRVVINAVDVLHSLYLPAFRQKIDAVPGRYTELWFEATVAGESPIFCTEYCGTGHSDMLSKVVIHEEGGFEAWMEEIRKKRELMPPLELGQLMYNQLGCSGCHSTDGTIKTGPSFLNVFGKSEALTDGTSATVDENYIRQSLEEPQAKIVQGFPPSMPTFKGKLSDAEIKGIIAFIKAQKK